MKYAGIGSRETPPNIMEKMEEIASALFSLGAILRTGGATGADTAFFEGVVMSVPEDEEKLATDKIELFLPWDGYNGFWCNTSETFHCNHNKDALEIVKDFHPAWKKCSHAARKMHARNAQIILGKDLDGPVDFVVCWTPNGEAKGGTATGIKMALSRNIPVYNLALPYREEDLYDEWIDKERNTPVNRIMW